MKDRDGWKLRAALICLLIFAALLVYASAQPAPARGASITGEVRLLDPWGRVGEEIDVRTIEVGGLECAVMVAGVERRTSMWCRAR